MRHVLVWGGAIIGVIVVLTVATLLIGMTLPAKHQVSRQETFPLPAARLWELSLAIFRRTNNGTFAIVEENPPHRLVTAIVGKNLPFGGTWTYEFLASGDETTLRVTERGEVYNPFFRFVSRYVMGYEGSLNTFFTALHNEARSAPPLTRP
jgi:hypothetical protein